MKAASIRPGDTLRLKPDNAYGFGPLIVTVREIRLKRGYRTPWIICDPQNNYGDEWAFKPSDFAGAA